MEPNDFPEGLPEMYWFGEEGGEHKDYLRENWEKEMERPEALLTDTQRRFLLGVFDYSGKNPRQQRYEMRERIRRRFVNGIEDLAYLQALDENSREKIIKELSPRVLYFRAIILLGYTYTQTKDRHLIEKIVNRAIYQAEHAEPELGDSPIAPSSVTTQIDVEYPPDLDSVYSRYENYGLSKLQPEEIGLLVENQRLEPEALARYYESEKDESEKEPVDNGSGPANEKDSPSEGHLNDEGRE